VALSTVSALAQPSGPPLRVRIVNGSDMPIVQLQLRTAGAPGWRNYVRPGHPFLPHRRGIFGMPGGADHCVLDLRLRTATGATLQRTVNFCRGGVFVYHGQP
jgi:hypothetical protein